MRQTMRWIYAGWLVLTVALIVIQFYLAGYAVFGFRVLADIGPHRIVGDLIGLASIVGIGLAFAARVPWRLTIVNGVFFVLMVVQAALAYTGIQVISALHVVNGLLILGVAAYLFRGALAFAKQQAVPAAAPAASAPAQM